MTKQVTGEQLRADIDAGRTGDKIPFPDPAAAPLATDAEAGGASTTFPSERRGDHHRSGRRWGGLWVYLGAIVAIAIAALLIINAAA